MPKLLNIAGIPDTARLLAALRAADRVVPGRNAGRVTQDVERWTAARVLAALAAAGRLDYPLSLQHGDKPDFQLKSGREFVGIEVTEAISPAYAECCALRDREYADRDPPPPIPMTEFGWDTKRMSIERMRQILDADRLSGIPVMGDGLQVGWADYVRSMLRVKTEKCRKPGYQRLPQTWLAVHDNLPLSGNLLEDAIDRLLVGLDWSVVAFDEILIEHSDVVAAISPHGVEIYPIPEL